MENSNKREIVFLIAVAAQISFWTLKKQIWKEVLLNKDPIR
jgi:hypothetical protein